jgi:hypothetical protein
LIQLTLCYDPGVKCSQVIVALLFFAADLPAGIIGTATVFSPSFNVQFDGNVADFQDNGPGQSELSINAVINWGDGNTTAGTVIHVGGIDFVVIGSHTYAQVGSFFDVIMLSDLGGAVQSLHGMVTVPEPPLLANPFANSFYQGLPFTGQIASFTEANSADTPADFAASIIWGDGNISPGTITSLGSGAYGVVGSHAFANSGIYAASVNVIDSHGPTISISGTNQAVPEPASALLIGGSAVAALVLRRRMLS